MSNTGNVIDAFDIWSVDLPFRHSFKHAAAEREYSNSVFVRCHLRSGAIGFGETLPRSYVTGESQLDTHDLLRDHLLPRLLGRSFSELTAVKEFLRECDGQAPDDWGVQRIPHTASWCAVDLALLDAFGHHFGESVVALNVEPDPRYRYSAVVSAVTGWPLYKILLKLRLYGIKQVKLKLGEDVGVDGARLLHRALGRGGDLRVDLNMMWQRDFALRAIPELEAAGVRSFEQPLPADAVADLAVLVKESGAQIMADESLNTAASLERLIAERACTAVNVRIAKCGGLIAAINRCEQARRAGLVVQVGCQVGESSLLSAAHLGLISQVQGIRYLEGCFGTLLLEQDPAAPELRFGRGGMPPTRPSGPGIGVTVDAASLENYSTRHDRVESRPI